MFAIFNLERESTKVIDFMAHLFPMLIQKF